MHHCLQVLVWSSYKPNTFSGSGNTITGMLDLTDDSVTEANVSNTKHDMFCPGAGWECCLWLASHRARA